MVNLVWVFVSWFGWFDELAGVFWDEMREKEQLEVSIYTLESLSRILVCVSNMWEMERQAQG